MNAVTHTKRIVTAALLVVVLAVALHLGGWVLWAAVLVFSGAALWEFYALFWPGSERRLKGLGLACTLVLLLAARLSDGPWPVLALMALFWAGNMAFLVRYSARPDDTRYRDSLVFLAGLLYIPLALQFFLGFSARETVYVILAAAASDTAAFYVGSLLGRRKVWPVISPKKSWAGSMGSLGGCAAFSLAYGLMLGSAPWYAWLGLAVVVNAAAQFGDFFESALKRSLAVKDSGALLPGHGGVLDRIDSLLFVLPVYALVRQAVTFFGQ